MPAIYLLCIQPAYRHAKHYVGFCEADDPARRVQEHLSCGSKASPLIRAALRAGHTVHHALTIPNGTRTDERRIKTIGHARRYCPLCNPNPYTFRIAAESCHG